MDENDSTMNDTVDTVQAQTAVSTDKSQAIILKNLESLIKEHISSVVRLQDESRKHRETLESIFQNDPTFQEHSEAARQANKIKSQTRAEILKRPSVIAVSNQMKDTRGQIKELQQELSEYLLEYQRMSGERVIEDNNGNILEIINSAKVVRSSSKR